MQTIFGVIVFAAGFGACWLCKDTLLRGTDALIKLLEAKLAVLRAKP